MGDYDVVVIGAGPGGYVGAIRAAQLGLKTAIVDKQWLGGVCLNVGCIPSKALLKNADVAHTLRERGKEFGFSLENLTLDYSVAVKRSRQVSDRLVKGVGFLMKKNNIDVYMGAARVAKPDTVVVTDKDGKTSELKTKNIVVATGASVAVPPGWVVDGQKIVTYLEAILQEKLPRSVVVIGAGAIGVEFATIWHSYGVEVTIVEMLPRIIPLEDEEASEELAKALKRKKITLLPGHRVLGIQATESGVQVKVASEEGEKTLEAEQALVAIGFKPNGRGLGLEELGVKLSERGAVEIDERMATNIPGIWAMGDVTAKLMLAHVGSAQGIICAENIAGVETITLNYEMMPHATYCQPQVASFGMTEAQAQGARLRREGRTLPLPAQRQSARSGRDYRLGEDYHRRQVWRNPGRPSGRSGSDRAAARADPGADDGADAARDRPQCACTSNFERGIDGSRPRGFWAGNPHINLDG